MDGKDGQDPGAAQLAALTLELCQVPSVTGAEGELAALLAARCQALPAVGPAGVTRLGNAVLARGPLRPGRPTVALFGHSDTVKPASDQPLGIAAGRVYGCGASDMKGGLAVMLTLLAEAEALGVNLRCVFYDREEGPADESGILPLCQGGMLDGIDLALCLEPTDNRVEGGCVGGLQAQVSFLGRRAHSARPWQGVNAIYQALPFLQRLQAFERRPRVIEGLTFYEVMTATQAVTENSRNVVPDRFTLNVNLRFAPDRERADAEAELRALVPPQAELRIVDYAPPGRVSLGQPLLRAWLARGGLEVAAKQAWTDVSRLTALGIPAVNFGPGETAQAHQARESVAIAGLARGYQALRDLLTGDGGPAPGPLGPWAQGYDPMSR